METPPLTPEPLPPSPEPSSGPSTQQWKVILHASAFSGFVIPFGNILGPLIVWLLKKVELPLLEPEGRKVLNFQISYMIYGIAAVIIGTVGSCLYVPIALPFVVGIAWLVFTIIGTVKASNGENYEFPLSLKLL